MIYEHVYLPFIFGSSLTQLLLNSKRLGIIEVLSTSGLYTALVSIAKGHCNM